MVDQALTEHQPTSLAQITSMELLLFLTHLHRPYPSQEALLQDQELRHHAMTTHTLAQALAM
jgi:hypothetical protein